MLTIKHPRPALGRQEFLGVEFRDGVATAETLHPELERALKQHGATIERADGGDVTLAEPADTAEFIVPATPSKRRKSSD